MAFSRQYAFLVLALLTSQVFAQEYTPICTPTDVFFVMMEDAGGDTQNWFSFVTYMFGSYPDAEFNLFGTNNDESKVQSPGEMQNLIGGAFSTHEWVVDDFTDFHDFVASNSRTGSRKVVIFGFEEANDAFDDSYGTIIAAIRRFRETPFADGTFAEVFATSEESNPELLDRNFLYDFVSNPFKDHVLFYNSGMGDINSFFPKISGVTGQTCASIGDPYVYSFDGTGYSFNGLGEYWFFRDFNVRIQVRMTTCNTNENPTSRTCNRAVAISSGSDNENVVAFYFDPVTELLLIEQNGVFIKGDNIFTAGGGSSISGSVQKADTAIDSDSIYVAAVIIPGFSGFYQVSLFFGKNTGAAINFAVPIEAYGTTLGLCGTFDGCPANDLYSANQTYTAPSARAEDVYFDFAETWKVDGSETLFSHGPNGAKYMPNYAEYPPAWAPAFSPVQPSASASSACAFLQGKSNFLYQACLDDFTKGGLDIRPISLLLAQSFCVPYCQDGISLTSVVTKDFCESLCPTDNAVDFHATYDFLTVPHSLESYNWGARFSATLGGTYTLALKSDFCPTFSATGTVRITCDQKPQVNAGQDRSVPRRNAFGFPFVFLQGSVTDTNPDVLEFSWQFVSWPLPNITAVPEDFDPITGTLSPPSLEFAHTLYPGFQPEFPGVYEIELAAFDGCLIGKDTVRITVACADCPLHIEATTPTDILYTYDDGFSSSSSNSFTFDYQFNDVPTFESAWFIDSNPQNLPYEMTVGGGNRDFTFYQPSFEDFNSTVSESIVTVNTQNVVDTVVGVNTDRILRFEGEKHLTTTTNTTTVVESTYFYYNTIPGQVDICSIRLDDGGSATDINVLDDFLLDHTDPMGTSFGCIGDYTLRAAARDGCKKGEDTTNLRVGCGARPDAHFRVCSKTLKYDYTAAEWPTIVLDASDTLDIDTPNGLLYRYEVISEPSASSLGPYLPIVGIVCTQALPATDVYEDCQQTQFTPTAPGQYELGVRVSDGCTNNLDSVIITTQCEPITLAVDAGTGAFNSASTGADYNTADVSATATSDNALSLIGWAITSPALMDRPATVGPATGDTSTITFHRQGSYSLITTVSDGCQTRTVTTPVSYTCSFALGTPAVSGSPTSPLLYDTDTRIFPTFTAAATTNAEESQGRSTYYYQVTSAPEGSAVLNLASAPAVLNGAPATFDVVPDLVGAYVVTFYVDDDCRTAQQTVAFSTACSNFAAPTISADTATGVLWNGPGDTLIISLTSAGTNPTHDLTWELIRPGGVAETISVSTIADFTVTSSGNHQIRLYESDGCRTAVSTVLNLNVVCNHTFSLGTIPAAAVSWVDGKFPRVQFRPVFNGDSNTPEEREAEITSYTWEFVSAPETSVFYAPPITTVAAVGVFNTTTPEGTYVPNFTPGEPPYYRLNEVTTTTVTTTVETHVFLDYNDNVGDRYAACFNPDVAGVYQLTFVVEDYCGVPKTVTASVTATCNEAPTADAGAAQTVTWNGVGFATDSGETYTAIELTGTADDNDDTELEYTWAFTSAPLDSTLMISQLITNHKSKLASFVPDVVGVYTLEFSVTDGCTTTISSTTVTVGCAATYSVSSYNFKSDGYTPVAIQSFPILATPRCNWNLRWELVNWDPSTGEGPNPPNSSGGGDEGSAAGHLAVPAFFVALMALLVKLF